MHETRILVVEDEGLVAEDIRLSLESLEYRVIGVAASGERALEILETEIPDMVLMDIMLQGELDGIETALLVYERYGIPVIFLTAHADKATLERAKVSQPFGYILKPFQEQDLRTSVEIAL